MVDPEHAAVASFMRAVLRREGTTPAFALPKGWISMMLFPPMNKPTRSQWIVPPRLVATGTTKWMECKCQE